ncbi:hypothetical protein ASD72_12865 [Pseudoxanthomonas sp. Root630]|nr:hypothetical protein ASD72_12865 [Pseudoxanthomonas sp. Root630]
MAYSDDLKRMSMEQIAQATSGWAVGTRDHWLCLFEIERRRNRGPTIRSWIAIAISVLALVVSVVGAI